MHLVYSAPQPKNSLDTGVAESTVPERALRYMAYLQTCEKLRHEIAAIRKYFPGWTPDFR